MVLFNDEKSILELLGSKTVKNHSFLEVILMKWK